MASLSIYLATFECNSLLIFKFEIRSRYLKFEVWVVFIFKEYNIQSSHSSLYNYELHLCINEHLERKHEYQFAAL